jgi:predicted metalloprotease with PDZ domain
MKTRPVRYAIVPKDPHAHLFEVACTVERPDPLGQRFRLPAWIPGSYMIREFARHFVSVKAEAGGRPVRIDKLDKHTWQAAPLPGARSLSVVCEVYAWDLSVRAAHLDQTHGFFNGPSVFLAVLGREADPCLVDIRPPAGATGANWRVATTLRPARGERGCARPHGFGLYRADDYDDLIDYPVEIGEFVLARFEACGVQHEVAITGRHDCDTERLCRDLKRICEWHIRLFGEPAPFERYLFLVTALGEGYGGLEHRDSTALLCSRNDLPHPGMEGMPETYRGFLGLCSHEYFHAWNVKRIRPTALVPPDLARENYTRLLWVFEGFTSYYDDLALARSGAIGTADYLELLAKTMTNVRRTPGRLRQSVAESSFDAWIKFYRQDENAPNAIVSYYAKGALVALALDLELRARSAGRISLDDVMRTLWRRHGLTGVGLAEGDMAPLIRELSGWNPSRFLARCVDGTEDPPLERLLRRFGVAAEWKPEIPAPSLGIKPAFEAGAVRLASVFDGGAARQGGLSAGDLLVAIDGLRVTQANLDKLLARRKAGDAVEIHAFRRDELMRFELKLQPAAADQCKLTLQDKPSAAARKLRRGWIGA